MLLCLFDAFKLKMELLCIKTLIFNNPLSYLSLRPVIFGKNIIIHFSGSIRYQHDRLTT